MDHFNEARMLVSFGAAKGKVFYLGAFGQEHGSRNPEVPDPNLGTLADVRRCYLALDAQVRRLATTLEQSQTEAQEASAMYSAPGV
jgi:hypothetical protein